VHQRYPASLILLTLNEIDGCRALFEQIPFEAVSEVVVVDGGSTDGTREFLQQKGLRVVGQEVRGRGEAFRVGCRVTSQPMLCYFSPDGNEDPADIPRLLARLDEGFELAIASRFLPASRNEEDSSWFRPRAWVNRTLTWIANRLFNHSTYVSDTINGYRAITRSGFEQLALTECGFPIEYQMSIRSMKKRFKIAELPTQEGDRVGGESKAKSFPVGWGHLKVLWQELSS
jgi:glycosyltransferase involved in cell wall biosynthesis